MNWVLFYEYEYILDTKRCIVSKAAGPTEDIQGTLVVGDDDIGPFSLQVLPATHLKPEAQQMLHMADQGTDNPGGKRSTQIHLQK